ncbi:hypothetical protein [Ligilactobacillus sp. Marseille-Q7487]|uniref:hypothetical protein n=1 Tax=Ligilactobacillus sp. Marseille-Q7487 TaxID=3022128 RepID=UPI0024A8915E|nr:hypothetical protein [Ligilactobacillus sp. Marseille-Q7487]
MKISHQKTYTLDQIMTTSELAFELEYSQSYILRVAKACLTENVDYRRAGKRNYLFTIDAYEKLKEILKIDLEI